MAVGFTSAGVAAAACLLSLVAPSLGAAAPPACDFKAECRPGEVYRLPIPCEGKCSNYIQCQDGEATEKRCGKFFWHQNEFDATMLDCVRGADCDWWRKVPASTTTPAPAPTTTPSAAPPETTPAASSTETTPSAEPSTSAVSTETTAQPTTPSAPSTTTPPPAPAPEPSPSQSGAAPLAAAGPALLIAALVLAL